VLEPGASLQDAVRAHLRASLVRAVGAKDGRFRFHPGDEFSGEVHAVEVSGLATALEGARLHLPAKLFAAIVLENADRYPVRTGDFQAIVPAAALESRDLRLALALDGRTTTREFVEARATDLKDALSLLWFLAGVGAVAFREAPERADAAYGKAPARRQKTLPADRAEAVRQAALQILPGTYFHALGLDVAADTEEVERAYHEVASRFHPDGFAEYDVGDLADLLASVQDKVSAAYRVLADPEKRRAYLAFLVAKLEASGARRPGIDLEAEIALKRGERALRARKTSEAVRALAEAVERNPREPEYLAMLAFARLHDPALAALDRGQEARKAARRALALAPDHLRALVVLALADAALGEPGDARKTVLAALRLHPGSDLAKRVLHHLNRVATA
jgi:tetratricopeptide (TPR) repeat protein